MNARDALEVVRHRLLTAADDFDRLHDKEGGWKPTADLLREAAQALVERAGEPVAWRFLKQLGGGMYAWTRWLGMDELQHYGPTGDLIKGPHPDWKVEYACALPPAAPGASHEQ